MRILVFQHADAEHPGVFRQLLAEDGHDWTAVNLHRGERPPDPEAFDALWVMGGPMDVWQEAEHPWLAEEKAIIRHAVADRGMAFLGLCLGHQLLAEALGGRVGPGTPEIGVLPVAFTEAGAESLFLDGIEAPFETLQWHGAEVKAAPEGARILATSPACAVQAMSWGPRALSMQFHVEVEPDTVAAWAAIPEYSAALERALGPGAADRLAAECAARMGAFNRLAERIYINWLQAQARPGS